MLAAIAGADLRARRSRGPLSALISDCCFREMPGEGLGRMAGKLAVQTSVHGPSVRFARAPAIQSNTEIAEKAAADVWLNDLRAWSIRGPPFNHGSSR